MSDKRFDHVLHKLLADHAAVVKHYNGARTAMRLFRKAAYRFASGWLILQKQHHNEFLAFAKNSNIDVTEWMDEHFAPIEEAGDNRQQLLKSIEDGMTEAEYVKQGHLWGVRKRSAASNTAKADTGTKISEDSMSDQERVACYKSKLGAAISELKQLRRDNAMLLREVERLQSACARIERMAATRNKKAG